MKNEKLLGAIGKIDDNLIHGAVNDTPKKKKPVWVKWGAAAACLCLVFVGGMLLFPGRQTSPPVYGVLAEVTGVMGDDRFEAIITGEDVNFSENDAVTVMYENTGATAIATGDTVAVSYSEFDKTEAPYKIDAGQVEIVFAD